MNIEELFNELDWYVFVNRFEVNCAVQETMMEEDIEACSFADCIEAGRLADEYIKDRGLKFDADLCVTLDKKNKCIHLSDLNWEFNEEQVERMEKLYNNAFLNACDCLYYWYGKKAWNDCGLEDEEARAKVWESAKQYMADAF